MGRITKTDAIQIVGKCALEYEEQLVPYKYLLICRHLKTKDIHCFEIRFPQNAFRHLTGLKMADKSQIKTALAFYNACINKKLSPDDIKNPSGTDAERKLIVLPQIIRFIRYSKMTVSFNNGRPKLRCDKVVGTTNFSMALDKVGKHFVPASCLAEDVRNFGDDISQVIVIFGAEAESTIYSDIKSVAKGVNLKNVIIPDEYLAIIDIKSYKEPGCYCQSI